MSLGSGLLPAGARRLFCGWLGRGGVQRISGRTRVIDRTRRLGFSDRHRLCPLALRQPLPEARERIILAIRSNKRDHIPRRFNPCGGLSCGVAPPVHCRTLLAAMAQNRDIEIQLSRVRCTGWYGTHGAIKGSIKRAAGGAAPTTMASVLSRPRA